MSISIGEFSHSTGMTIRTLRYYHDIGLLEAARVDEFSGYRYYRADQLARAGLLRLLRATGMGIAEMRQVLSHPNQLGEQLAAQRTQLQVQRRLEDWALERAATWSPDLQRVNPVLERHAGRLHWAGFSTVVDTADLEQKLTLAEEALPQLERDLLALVETLRIIFDADSGDETPDDRANATQSNEGEEFGEFIANSWTSFRVDKVKSSRVAIGLCFPIPGPLPAGFSVDEKIASDIVSGVLPERTEAWIRTASFADSGTGLEETGDGEHLEDRPVDDDTLEELLPGGSLPSREGIALALYLEERGITEPREIRQRIVHEVDDHDGYGADHMELSITLD
ncbi:MerR family transcriptional regulator [Trueperella pecoris]|uniref:MerR family transcriptional regulator n=1 Tax=Trueperella pecoris TaxID=2733571 RepID=A0A7M1R215_9ACTO|nr:MerR family transcriptional regulator [Trueperella pecoris]QOR48329.1 MerR family transcriptional regulator [Trueperella pecoris]